jgi:hypothetical protein
VKLEIEDKEIIEFIVTLKQRLDRIENELHWVASTIIAEEELLESEQSENERRCDCRQPLSMPVILPDSEDIGVQGVLSDEDLEAIAYTAMPTYENLSLYNAIPLVDITDDQLRKFYAQW